MQNFFKPEQLQISQAFADFCFYRARAGFTSTTLKPHSGNLNQRVAATKSGNGRQINFLGIPGLCFCFLKPAIYPERMNGFVLSVAFFFQAIRTFIKLVCPKPITTVSTQFLCRIFPSGKPGGARATAAVCNSIPICWMLYRCGMSWIFRRKS